MAKFLIMIFTAAALLTVFALTKNQKIAINNGTFSFDDYRKAHDEKVDLVEQLAEQKHAGAKHEAEAEAPAFKVVLETEEEKSGQASYEKRCVVCHGKMGEGKKSQNAPKLGGQFAWYVIKQLTDMKDKRRINKVMDPYLKPLSDKDFKELSAYIAKLPW